MLIRSPRYTFRNGAGECRGVLKSIHEVWYNTETKSCPTWLYVCSWSLEPHLRWYLESAVMTKDDHHRVQIGDIVYTLVGFSPLNSFVIFVIASSTGNLSTDDAP